jgi:rhodanese-related sulfurtransferase
MRSHLRAPAPGLLRLAPIALLVGVAGGGCAHGRGAASEAPAAEPGGKPGGPPTAAFAALPVEAWKRALEASPGAQLLDVRRPEEHAAGALPGARLLPHTTILAGGGELPADRRAPLFLYCRSGKRSALASQALADRGYRNVHSLEGGIEAWRAAGLPITTTAK